MIPVAARNARRTTPEPPDLPPKLEDAPAALVSRDSWDGMHAEGELEVAGTVADVELIECVFTGIDLTSRTLTGLRARDVVLERCDLSGAVLDGAVLDRVEFRNCRLTGTMLTATTLTDVVIADCVANLVNFRAARARRLFVEDSVLTEADLYTASLTDSAFLDCDLRNANVDSVRLERVSLHGSMLDGINGAASLTGACIDHDQLIPMGAALVAGLGIRVATRPNR